MGDWLGSASPTEVSVSFTKERIALGIIPLTYVKGIIPSANHQAAQAPLAAEAALPYPTA